MKVLYLTPTYYDAESVIGGGERYVHELARHVGQQAEVECISFGAARVSRKMENYRLEIFPAKTTGAFSVGNPWAFRWLSRLFWADVVHVHQISTVTGDLATLFCALRRTPVFVTDHGGGGGRILNQRLPWLLQCQAGIAQSAYAADLLNAKGVGSVVQIPGGVDLSLFQRHQSVSSGSDIVFVGRLLEHKGPHLLLEALRQLPEWKGSAWIFGRPYDSDYLDRLRHLAEDLPVSIVHDASDVQLADAVSRARLLVNPAMTPRDPETGRAGVSELMGISVLEAMAAGTPVVVSSAGALAEIVQKTGYGAVFAEGSVDDLTRVLRDQLDQPSPLASDLIEAVRRFSWSNVSRRIVELYQDHARN